MKQIQFRARARKSNRVVIRFSHDIVGRVRRRYFVARVFVKEARHVV
jgi:hypothetical protein